MERLQLQIGTVLMTLIVNSHIANATEAFAYVADQEDQLLVEKIVPPVVGPPKPPAPDPIASVEQDPLKDWENSDQFDAYLVKQGTDRETAKVDEQSKKLQKRFKASEDSAPMVISSKKRSKKTTAKSSKGRKISSRK